MTALRLVILVRLSAWRLWPPGGLLPRGVAYLAAPAIYGHLTNQAAEQIGGS